MAAEDTAERVGGEAVEEGATALYAAEAADTAKAAEAADTAETAKAVGGEAAGGTVRSSSRTLVLTRRARWVYRVLVFILTALGLMILNGLFFMVPAHQLNFVLSPFQCMGIMLCLFCGWPAILGCLIGDAFLLVFMQHLTGGMLAVALVVATFLYAFPYLVWYGIFGRSESPYPTMDSVRKLGTCLVLVTVAIFVWAAVASRVLLPALVDANEYQALLPEDFFRASFFVPFAMATVVGVLMLILFERCYLVPLAPRWVTVPYRRGTRMNLTERLVFVIDLSMLLMVVFSFLPYLDMVTPDTPYIDVCSYVMSTVLYGGETALVVWFFVVAMLWYLERHFTRPIELLADAARVFPDELAAYQRAEGDDSVAPEELATMRRRVSDPVAMGRLEPMAEVADLTSDTDAMRSALVSYLDELRDVTAENERVRAELDIASQIQAGAVPHEFKDLMAMLSVDIAASMTPAREVGGDFYDAFAMGQGKLGVIMADVSGKGMPAALFMMRALADIRESMLSIPDVGQALTKANQTLCTHNDAMLFVTAFICVLDVATGEVRYANAGHNPAWILGGPREGGHWLQAKPGLVLGVMDIVSYTTETLQLQPGEGLFLYTDGVTEAMDPESQLYGEPRLDAVLTFDEEREGGEASATEAVDDVLADVHAFAHGAPQADDITALAFRWVPGDARA